MTNDSSEDKPELTQMSAESDSTHGPLSPSQAPHENQSNRSSAPRFETPFSLPQSAPTSFSSLYSYHFPRESLNHSYPLSLPPQAAADFPHPPYPYFSYVPHDQAPRYDSQHYLFSPVMSAVHGEHVRAQSWPMPPYYNSGHDRPAYVVYGPQPWPYPPMQSYGPRPNIDHAHPSYQPSPGTYPHSWHVAPYSFSSENQPQQAPSNQPQSQHSIISPNYPPMGSQNSTLPSILSRESTTTPQSSCLSPLSIAVISPSGRASRSPQTLAQTPSSPQQSDESPAILEQSSARRKKGSDELTCHICLKSFTRRYNLQSHLLCHSNIRQFSCDQCPATFVRKHDLRRHERSLHSDDKPYKCHLCDQSFSRSDGLNRHSMKHERKGKRKMVSTNVDRIISTRANVESESNEVNEGSSPSGSNSSFAPSETGSTASPFQ